jgi:hypothetical protein
MDKDLQNENLDRAADLVFDYMKVVCNNNPHVLSSLYYKVLCKIRKLKTAKIYDSRDFPLWQEPKNEQMVYPVDVRP